MKLVICWTHYSGYMAACWRELARLPGIDMHVVCFTPPGQSGTSSFTARMPESVSCDMLDERSRHDHDSIERIVRGQQPDVVVIPGWSHPGYSRLVAAAGLRQARFVMAMDTPYRGDLRQRLARLWLRRLLGRIDRVVVPGERARAYAERLGVPPDRIHRGLYAYDQELFHEGLHRDREGRAGGWPRSFLFVGRYVPQKALDVLVAGYRQYRTLVTDPWPLACCGHGPLGRLLIGVPGVEDRGFVQPEMQPALFADHGVFVLPSRYEPWGVAVAEAMASGLPAICSSACNAAVSLLHPYWNGLEVPPEDPAALARAMRWMHDNHQALPEMGRAAAGIAKAYAACQWAVRWRELCLAACRNDRRDGPGHSP